MGNYYHYVPQKILPQKLTKDGPPKKPSKLICTPNIYWCRSYWNSRILISESHLLWWQRVLNRGVMTTDWYPVIFITGFSRGTNVCGGSFARLSSSRRCPRSPSEWYKCSRSLSRMWQYSWKLDMPAMLYRTLRSERKRACCHTRTDRRTSANLKFQRSIRLVLRMRGVHRQSGKYTIE